MKILDVHFHKNVKQMRNSFQSSYGRKEENKKKERKLRQNVMERKQEEMKKFSQN